MLDRGVHGKMFYFAKAGWWDRRVRIVVACSASPFEACGRVCLSLRTRAVQAVRAEGRWPYREKLRSGKSPSPRRGNDIRFTRRGFFWTKG